MTEHRDKLERFISLVEFGLLALTGCVCNQLNQYQEGDRLEDHVEPINGFN